MNQCEAIIKYLKTHKSIDFSKAAKLGISQFHTRKKELEEIGYVFGSEWFEKRNQLGSYRCKEYTLLKEPK